MKQFYCLVSLAILACACTVNEPEETVVNNYTYPAEISACIDDNATPDSKVYADENLKVLWNHDDRISLFNKYTYNKEYYFFNETGANAGVFKEVTTGEIITGNELDYVYGVYPYSSQTTISNSGVISLNLPGEQAYGNGTFGLGANTMVSATTNTELLFKNLCGYLILKLYGDNVDVSSITLQGNNHEVLSGPATVTATVGDTPTFAFAGSGTSETITLNCATPVHLGTSASDATVFWLVVPPTTFSQGFTITVTDPNGKTFSKSTTKSVIVSRNATYRMGAIDVIIATKPVPEAVDMGLSVKWGSFNLGASSSEEYGEYYAWGEIHPKASYSWNTYLLCNGSNTTLTKYNSENDYGVVDNKYVLELEDDAAHHHLKGNWRMPSEKEWEELINPDNCDWVWTTQNAISGYLITSKRTDNSIFIPAAGHKSTQLNLINSRGYYWLNELPNPNSEYWASYYHSGYPLIGDVRSSSLDTYTNERYMGNSIRPILDDVQSALSCDDHFDLIVGGSRQLSITNQNSLGLTFFSKNESIATIDNTGTIHAVSVGTTTVRVSSSDGKYSAYCSVTIYPAPEIVDLGLSVKWASFNIGASAPAELGFNFAWGEVSAKTTFSWATYKWCNGTENTLTKYNSNSSFGIVDNKDVLDDEDDVANLWSNGQWRMPTRAEAKELHLNCTREQNNSTKTATFTSNINGNSIVFPMNPNGDFTIWVKNLSYYSYTPTMAPHLSYTSLDGDCWEISRYSSGNIRAVYVE
ncbi:MAG: Ig-like domain-containing protein [Bacteroidales bacterium]|nr:Ig-like domain-containing protein [Bacteroidales bacterium]